MTNLGNLGKISSVTLSSKPVLSQCMDGLIEFLEAIRQNQLARGYLRPLFYICIGKKITKTDGTVVSTGVTWRQLADLLRIIRWDKDLVRELGLDPDKLSPRDRQRYWYLAIAAADIGSSHTQKLAEDFAKQVIPLGYQIG